MGVCGEEWSVRGRKRWGRKDKVEWHVGLIDSARYEEFSSEKLLDFNNFLLAISFYILAKSGF
jgi:hypothetical protein